MKLVEVVGDSVYQAMGLKECLEDERKALEAQDAEALFTAIECKEKCINKLQSLENQRSRLGATAGFNPGRDQMEQLQDWCGNDVTMTNSWQHLMEIAAKCNDLNMRNGAIIRLRKQQVETSLSVVRGGSSGTDTYDRNGTEPGGQQKRSLAEA